MDEEKFMEILKVAGDCNISCAELYSMALSLKQLEKAAVKGAEAGTKLREILDELNGRN